MEKDKADYIERLLTDTFDDYSVPEFKNSWPAIKSEVFRKQFFKFNLYQFNAYYGIVVAATMITAGILLFSPSEQEKGSTIPIEVENIMENPVVGDTLATEEIVKVVPEISEKDTLDEMTDTVAPQTSHSVVPEREAEVVKDLEVEFPSSNKLEESSMEPNDSIVNKPDLDSLSSDALDAERKKVIVVEPPVVKRDTVVKVIRERRRRR